jgi:hypothetical protein
MTCRLIPENSRTSHHDRGLRGLSATGELLAGTGKTLGAIVECESGIGWRVDVAKCRGPALGVNGGREVRQASVVGILLPHSSVARIMI